MKTLLDRAAPPRGGAGVKAHADELKKSKAAEDEGRWTTDLLANHASANIFRRVIFFTPAQQANLLNSRLRPDDSYWQLAGVFGLLENGIMKEAGYSFMLQRGRVILQQVAVRTSSDGH